MSKRIGYGQGVGYQLLVSGKKEEVYLVSPSKAALDRAIQKISDYGETLDLSKVREVEIVERESE